MPELERRLLESGVPALEAGDGIRARVDEPCEQQDCWESHSRFLFYDGFARIGANLPIRGGPDTLTEHRTNRLADLLVRTR